MHKTKSAQRLTEEMQIGPFAALKDKAEAVPGAFGTYDCLYAHMVAVTRLKEYEDTGLTPEEIMLMKDSWHAVCKAYGLNGWPRKEAAEGETD